MSHGVKPITCANNFPFSVLILPLYTLFFLTFFAILLRLGTRALPEQNLAECSKDAADHVECVQLLQSGLQYTISVQNTENTGRLLSNVNSRPYS